MQSLAHNQKSSHGAIQRILHEKVLCKPLSSNLYMGLLKDHSFSESSLCVYLSPLRHWQLFNHSPAPPLTHTHRKTHTHTPCPTPHTHRLLPSLTPGEGSEAGAPCVQLPAIMGTAVSGVPVGKCGSRSLCV